MPVGRPRANSLHIAIPTAGNQQWKAVRPSTPRRSTYPQAGTALVTIADIANLDSPPVPPISYWEPDTPDIVVSPLSLASPRNPFLYPHPSLSPRAMFPMASPVLPASPLSIFDRMISPMTPTFLCPRTSPLPLLIQAERLVARRYSTMRSVQSSELENARYEKLQNMLESIWTRVVAEMTLKKEEATTISNKGRLLGLRKKTGSKQKEKTKVFRQKGAKIVKGAIVDT
jgi:hypothetical protein